MRIVFKKEEDVYGMMRALVDFMLAQAKWYPLLKEGIEINIELKNNIGQICPDNEREFYYYGDKIVAFDLIGAESVEEEVELDEDEEEALDWEMREQWRLFINTNTHFIEHEIETDRKYISTAREKGRNPKYVEIRKKRLKRNEEELKRKREQENRLKVFIEKVRKNEVKYRFERDVVGDKIKVMLFEQDGRMYVFRYVAREFWKHNIFDEDGMPLFDSDL